VPIKSHLSNGRLYFILSYFPIYLLEREPDWVGFLFLKPFLRYQLDRHPPETVFTVSFHFLFLIYHSTAINKQTALFSHLHPTRATPPTTFKRQAFFNFSSPNIFDFPCSTSAYKKVAIGFARYFLFPRTRCFSDTLRGSVKSLF
jgi:hypothetical protein